MLELRRRIVQPSAHALPQCFPWRRGHFELRGCVETQHLASVGAKLSQLFDRLQGLVAARKRVACLLDEIVESFELERSQVRRRFFAYSAHELGDGFLHCRRRYPLLGSDGAVGLPRLAQAEPLRVTLRRGDGFGGGRVTAGATALGHGSSSPAQHMPSA